MVQQSHQLSLGARSALKLLRVYKVLFSTLFSGSCRFYPSCSDYARDAIELHGCIRGAAVAVRRLARCHPLGGSGFDPVTPSASNAPRS